MGMPKESLLQERREGKQWLLGNRSSVKPDRVFNTEKNCTEETNLFVVFYIAAMMPWTPTMNTYGM